MVSHWTGTQAAPIQIAESASRHIIPFPLGSGRVGVPSHQIKSMKREVVVMCGLLTSSLKILPRPMHKGSVHPPSSPRDGVPFTFFYFGNSVLSDFCCQFRLLISVNLALYFDNCFGSFLSIFSWTVSNFRSSVIVSLFEDFKFVFFASWSDLSTLF